MTPQLLISLIALIAGIIYFSFPYIHKKYFQRPFLTLEIEPNLGITMSRKHIGYSHENDFSLPVNRPEVISVYEVIWKFDLIIRNNSEYDSYNIELFNSGVSTGQIIFKSKVNQNKPLPKHEEIIVPFEYILTAKVQNKDAKSLDTKEPQEFSNLEILLNYENSRKRSFNTTFNMGTKELKYDRIKKEKINKYWR